jgi:bacillithiol biosynthesis deacetylase BshB1
MLDVLSIGAHPDDAELGSAGFLIEMKKKGYRVGVLDLTRGEMGTRGTVVERMSEAETAAKILGLDIRENLELPDGLVTDSIENRQQLARMLRKLKPHFVVGPYFVDKHPDHEAAGRLIKSAVFDARLKKLDLKLPPHSVRAVFYYPSHLYFTPSFVVDISGSFDKKMEVIQAYVSQFIRKKGVDKNFRPIGISDYLFQIESRNRHFGSLIGKKYGEGFLMEGIIEVSDPHQLFGELGGAKR